ncbi:hypothetical protein HJC23_008422 [Cyclotella cryptica]|uniref:Uncharacterized protein n=1 Tax=Cyclotella cryptica TaxID=29204 RepID=A0ABD3PWX7_9STRA|eukprot:CCRYP_010721-RA/>CCRYP_010721-RA protein AED:0.23 eAED:0.23 QI:819/1/0.75/1/0.33/0/4/2060/133
MQLFQTKVFTVILTTLSVVENARAFVPTTCPSQMSRIRPDTILQSYDGGSFGGNGQGGGMEEIEFRIYPDGRITEVVRGVKGASCEKVTEAINKQLGNVVHTQPTEEMFEQELVIEQTVDQKLGGEWDGATSW